MAVHGIMDCRASLSMTAKAGAMTAGGAMTAEGGRNGGLSSSLRGAQRRGSPWGLPLPTHPQAAIGAPAVLLKQRDRAALGYPLCPQDP